MKTSTPRRLLLLACLLFAGTVIEAAPQTAWQRDEVQAWCIVPYDARKRSPEERAAMLRDLGLRRYAYDYRAEHVPTFDREIVAMKQAGIELTAWWFPAKLDATAQAILAAIERHGIRPALWVTGGGAPAKTADEQRARVANEVQRLTPIAAAAKRLGCRVGLYNHGGWFGDPDNQLEVLRGLRAAGFDQVGLVYNFHHAHEHLRTFAAFWPRIAPYVDALNLSGLVEHGDRTGKKILYLGEGDREAELLGIVRASGWRGQLGVLCHRTDVDAAEALRRNLAGYDRLVGAAK